jgi:DNA-binding transcriptional LysR family regulator
LAPDRLVIAASPAYLARRGRPARAEDLAGHSCLVFADRSLWTFTRNGAETAVRVGGPLRSNSGEMLCLAALEGNGLIRASELEVWAELASGQLVEVLADHEISSKAAVWAIYPSVRHMLPRMRVLLDFMTEWFRDVRTRPGNGMGLTPVLQRAPAKVGLHPA